MNTQSEPTLGDCIAEMGDALSRFYASTGGPPAKSAEMTLEAAREIPLHDMNQAELTVVILHDPDICERRAALRLFKLSIVLEAEMRILETLRQVRK